MTAHLKIDNSQYIYTALSHKIDKYLTSH